MRLAGACLALVVASGGMARAQSPADLVRQVVEARRTSGFTLRARLVTGGVGTAARPTTVQVRAIGRTDAEGSRTLYQVLWPEVAKGRAVSVEVDRAHGMSGFIFTPPDTVTPLSPALVSTPLFDSELTVDDLLEDFWTWPDPAAAGEDAVGGQPCRTVALHRPAGVQSPYATVRACISVQKSMPLLVEKVDEGGRTRRRYRVEKAVKRNDHWTAVKVVAEDVERKRTTTIEVSRGERDTDVSPSQFTLASVKRGAQSGTATSSR